MPHTLRIIELLASTASGRHLLAQPGHVLNSGWSAVVPGGLYVIGLNPAGDTAGALSVEKQIRGTPCGPRSAYNEAWGLPVGTHKHQVAVKDYLRVLGLTDAAAVPASNVYFLTSGDADSLKRLAATPAFGGLASLARVCWSVHEYLLSIVRPRLILCLGNGQDEGMSAFEVVSRSVPAETWSRSDMADYRSGKWFTAPMRHSNGQDVLVFGVPHPSRFPASAGLRQSLAEQARRVGWPSVPRAA